MNRPKRKKKQSNISAISKAYLNLNCSIKKGSQNTIDFCCQFRMKTSSSYTNYDLISTQNKTQSQYCGYQLLILTF